MIGLAPEMYLASLGTRAIVLDLKADRYLALPPVLANAALAALASSGGEAHDSGLAVAQDALISRGILTQSRPFGARTPPPPRPARTLWPDRSGGDGSQLSVHHALARVWFSLRARRLLQTIKWMRRLRQQGHDGDLQSALNSFFAARPWFPVKPICRLDAPALYMHLLSRGCRAQLVFGVMLEPLAAHCWVQAGDQIINEPHEVVAGYTPIMVVGPK